MAELKTYKVVREHEGDRPYAVGDTRKIGEADAAHLVPHVLQPVGGKAKAPAPSKAASKPKGGARAAAVPANKAEPILANKESG